MLRQAANDVLRNDVALRAKGKLHFPNTNAPDFLLNCVVKIVDVLYNFYVIRLVEGEML